MPRLSSLAGKLADTLGDGGWRSKARPEQLPPPGDDWNGWLLMAGRGFGKTRTGAEWIKELVETGAARHIALVGPTAGDVRDVMCEGPSGILAVSSPWCRPEYEPSKRRLTWPTGAVASTFSSEEADRLRGPQHDALWADELASWNDPQSTWDQAMFGLRVGVHPRWLVTTTPRPIKLLKELLARKDVVTTRGSTFANAENLAGPFLEAIRKRYENTRLGRQELNAELLLDVQGALWTRDMLDRANGAWKLPDMKRVVVAVDPSGTRGQEDGGDSVGIVVAGLGADGLGYVLADRTCKLSPDGWGRAAVAAYRDFKADRIVAERNFGGAMVEHVTVGPRGDLSRWLIDSVIGPGVTVTQNGAQGVPDLRAPADLMHLYGAGVPSAATGANQAAVASLYTDLTNAKLYINGGSKAVPSWKIVTSA